jgi:hypothetical protein
MKTETILMVLVAFIIGWFLKTMIHGGLVEGAERDNERGTCKVDEQVLCPDKTTPCAGNQCCPGGYLCPSADNNEPHFCASGKDFDCTPPSKITFPNKMDPDAFLKKLKTAYNEGENGVLISVMNQKNRTSDEYFNLKDPPTIDSSGSIIKKDTNASIYTIRGKNFMFGYIWDPDININIVQCAYTTHSDTNSRLSNFNDKCGRNLEAQSDKNHTRDKAIKLSAPIMCDGKASSKIKCNKSSYCFTQDENAKSYPNCNDGECDEPLCDKNENCIQCMLRQGKEQQGEYSNFHYVNCPNCIWNEVVLDRYGREKLYTERYQKNDKNQPSAIFIGIDNKFPYTNSVDCEEIFKMSSSQTESTTNALFKYIQKYFSEDTIVILIQYQDMWNDLNFKNIKFLNGYKVRDIYDISNDKSPLCSNNGN